MSEAFEYEIRKDVRNNAIVREVDAARHRELWKSVAIVLLFIGVVMFAGLQRTGLRQNDYQIHELQNQLKSEEDTNRRLKVDVERASAPERIEREARKQGLVPSATADAVYIETATSSAQPDTSSSDAVVARR